MQVTRFQMHNVLECYSKKLSTAPGGERTAGGPSKKSADETALSPETSRMAAMDKISQQVLDKVMDAVALSGAPPVRWPVRHAHDEGAEGAVASAPVEFTSRLMGFSDRGGAARLVMGDAGE